MPRAIALKVKSAPKSTRWTLGHDSTPTESPSKAKATDSMMQANGGYFDHQRSPPLPRYSDYDGSHYGESHYDGSHDSMDYGRRSDVGWKQPESLSAGEFDAFDFHQTPMNDLGFDHNQATPRDERKSLNLNTHVPNHIRPHNPDEVGRHLLYETALLDTQTYEILDIAEVDALKKEQDRLSSKIEAAQRKLALESKVRNAAQNLQRLYSTSKRPDTPQSPDSPRKHRNSLLGGGRGRKGSNETFQQADQELASSVKKVDELHEQVTDLLNQRQNVERKLLRHTAAVLAEEANSKAESGVPGMMNGHHFDDDDSVVGHAYSDFDGIRDILHGRPAGTSTTSHQQEEHLAQMQEKLEQLNSQLRNIISEAGQTLGRTPAAEVGLDESEDSSARIENRFARLEQNLHTLEQQSRDIKAVGEQHMQVMQQQEQDLKSVEEQFEKSDRDMQAKVEEIEEHLEGVNGQLHNAILQASEGQPVPGLQEPPRARDHGYQEQLQYMEDSLLTMEQLLQQRGQTDDLLDAQSKVEDLKKKNGEYEAVVGGLWDILQSENDTTSPRPDSQEGDNREPPSPLKEAFSLQAFNTRVQSLFQRVESAREQQDILRRQIQQQRDLGGKSDMEKEQQIADIQGKHDKLAEEHGTVQRELSSYMVKHEEAVGEVEQSRSELTKVTEEIEELKRTVDKQQQERDEMAKQVEEMEEEIKELEQQLDVQDDKADKHEELESEVVRLTTELTMAKAELDGAYGTRAERAGAQAAEVTSLNEKNRELGEKHDAMTSELESLRTEVESLRPLAKGGEHSAQLERELQEMTNEFQELTKESIALEREREQLDGLIDNLRDRCDELENQLSDERLQRTTSREDSEGREQRHMLVLKQEFKKMMREQKAEGGKVLRAEQEERRKLEAELRKLRQANGPLAKSLMNGVGSDGASSPAPA